MSIVVNETEKPIATAGAVQPNAAGQSRFTVTLKGNVVYVNGLTLGMSEDAAKEEMRKLNYELENVVSGRITVYDGLDSLRVSLRNKRVISIETNETDISDASKNEIVKSLKASFGDKMSCQESSNSKREMSSCNYTHSASGDRTSLTVTFMKRRGQKGNKLTIGLGLR